MTTAVMLTSSEKLTFEEFLVKAGEDRAEWVDGDIEFMSPVTKMHQEVSGFLLTLIKLYVEMCHLGTVFYENFPMRLDTVRRGREPDIFFVAEANLDRIQETFLDGPADLVIEIVSDESQERDRDTKREEYRLGGVQEYWLIDPLYQEALFYQLDTNGAYRVTDANAEGIYHSMALKSFWLKVNWLWQRPLPEVMPTLKELGLI